MASTDGPKDKDPVSGPGRGRRAVHLVVAFAGWVIFIYWWLIVLRAAGRPLILQTAILVLVSIAVVVIVTLAWVAHNLGIARRRGARRNAPVVLREDLARDHLGRPVRHVPDLAAVRGAPLVTVRLDAGSKVYEVAPGRAPGSRPAAS